MITMSLAFIGLLHGCVIRPLNYQLLDRQNEG